MSSLVLVVTRGDDVTADVVVEELYRRAVPVVRMDPGDYPVDSTLTAHYDTEVGGRLATPSRDVDLTDIRAVYWRRPSPWGTPAGLDEQSTKWCAAQAHYGAGGVIHSLPQARYINHPLRIQAADYKPAQLAAAIQCGFDIPPTLITNEPGAARAFAGQHGRIVCKALRQSDYIVDNRQQTIWVEPLGAAELTDGIAATAHQFQKYIGNNSHLRLTAVGESLFCVRIGGAPTCDWRRHYDNLTYTLIDTPPHLVRPIHAYLDHFGLVFGAFDFGIDQDDRPWWYECNPNGQWAWFPEDITSQIACAIADELQLPEQP
jgi:ATP-grasp ribosomal peptide maturase